MSDSFFQIYLFCALGIVISVLLPIVAAYVKQHFRPPEPAAVGDALSSFWSRVLKPYLALGLLALLGAFLIVAAQGDELQDPRAALLAGYAWQATLEKLLKPA